MAGSALLDALAILDAVGVRSGMRVADFGAGRTGHFALPALRLVGEDGVVYAIDIHPECLAMVEGHRKLGGLTNLETLQGDIERSGGVPLDSQSIDIALVVNTLWQARNHLAIARELRRVLRQGGKAVVIDWHPNASHVAAPPAHVRVPDHAADMVFRGEGWHAERFTPSAWHWGRIFAS